MQAILTKSPPPPSCPPFATPQLAALGCSEEQVERVQQLRGGPNMNSTRPFVPLYWRQHLYSIYVHSQPSYTNMYEPDT